MQILWSRVAQTRGTCHCPQCLQCAAPGVSRRATASATRQAPRFLTSSTLMYSGIFAAAATFDAGAKKQRREQWDQAIAGLKQELGQGTADAQGLGASVQPKDHDGSVATEDGVDVSSDGADVDVDLFDDVAPQRRTSQWPANTGPELVVRNLPPQSIYAKSISRERAEKQRWVWRKLERVMLSMDMLQVEMFYRIHEQSQCNDGWLETLKEAVPEEYLRQIDKLKARWKTALRAKRDACHQLWLTSDDCQDDYSRPETDVRLCDYNQDDLGNFRYTTRELNTSLQYLFREHARQKLSTPFLLAKVAYNLHICNTPPDLHTYNTLLLGLSRAEEPKLVDGIIRSLRGTRVRPNEVTNTAILDHYRTVGDKDGFMKWCALLRGKKGGLALARSDINITEAGRSRLIFDEEYPNRIIQLPYPTPNVFGALIKGVLEFGSFDTALGLCESMGHEGWGLCMGGLTPLLKDCADRGDWGSGLAVWRQIEALRVKSGREAVRRGEVEKIGYTTYATMIRLCARCKKENFFDDVWRRAVSDHPRAATRIAEYVKKADREAAMEAAKRVVQVDESRDPLKTPADDTICHESSDVLDEDLGVEPMQVLSDRPEEAVTTSQRTHALDDDLQPSASPSQDNVTFDMETERESHPPPSPSGGSRNSAYRYEGLIASAANLPFGSRTAAEGWSRPSEPYGG